MLILKSIGGKIGEEPSYGDQACLQLLTALQFENFGMQKSLKFMHNQERSRIVF